MKRTKQGPDRTSCGSCRVRKLRCSRKAPCSNCVARHIPCSLSTIAQRSPCPSGSATSDARILKRLETLERLTLPATVLEPAILGLHTSEHATPEAREETDLQELESIGTGVNLAIHTFQYLSRGLDFRTGSVDEILAIHEQRAQSCEPRNTVILPSYELAVKLFQNYVTDANHVCRIIHAPTIGSKMKGLYLDILQRDSVDLSQAALLLSIFALSMYFNRPSLSLSLAKTQVDMALLSRLWGNQALDVLDHSIRASGGSIENAQAYILMSYHIYHFEGFSARQRFLSTAALSIARDLRLHRLDLNENEQSTDLRVVIDDEVKRRVFWHLASTEWLNSTISGPQEGTYLLSLNQIETKSPRNCTDDCMLAETSDSDPEGMIFFLKRLEIAHICREMTDTLPTSTTKLMQTPYENILAMDKKLMHVLDGLPKFLRTDRRSREDNASLEVIYPKIPVMRYYINTTVHSRRCRLHHRYLLRQQNNPKFAYSRQAALESACAIIKAFDLGRSTHSDSASTTRMGTAIHMTQLAMVTIVTDLRFNEHLPLENSTGSDVEACLSLLATFRGTSAMMDQSLDRLDQYLGNQTVKTPLLGTPVETSQISTATGCLSLGQKSQFVQADAEQCASKASPLCDFWQAVDQNMMGADISEWDSLFAALDCEPI